MRGELLRFYYPSILIFVLGDQKNNLTEMVLLSIHNICYDSEIRKIIVFMDIAAAKEVNTNLLNELGKRDRRRGLTNILYGAASAVNNVSGNRCESDCRSRGREFDPSPFPYFRGD